MRRLSTALSAAFLLAALASVSSAQRRVAHTATLLPNGDVLLAGGVDETETTLATSDLFAASKSSGLVAAGNMTVARASHTATLLFNGCVLAVGGDGGGGTPTATAEIYDPTTRAWSSPGSLVTARYNHTAVLLNDGRVMICGGQTAAGAAIPGCEFYTPTSCAAGGFTAAPNLLQARYNHTAVLLKDGRVWFAGGRDPAVAANGGYLSTTERYNPDSNAFQSAAPLIEARSQHTATLMGDGKALVVGGFNLRDVLANTGITESAEIYDPISNTAASAAPMSARREAHSATLSADGKVVVFGGLGNITTTFLTTGQLNLGGNILQTGSSVTFGSPNAPLASVTAGAAFLKLDLLLGKPVVGSVQSGEIRLSSPAVTTAWGSISFVSASETNPAVGARIDLAGVVAGCRVPFPPITGNCGNILTPAGSSAPVSNLLGQVVFDQPTVAINGSPAGLPIVTAGTMSFTSSPLTSGSSPLIPAGSSFTATVSITVDKDFIGRTLNSGSISLSAGARLVHSSSFTVTLSSGSAIIPPTVITAGPSGNSGVATFAITFTGLEGTIEFQAAPGQSLVSPLSIPLAGGEETVTASGILTYTTNGANLSAETFSLQTATIVVRRMVLADFETYNPQTNAWTLKPLEGDVSFNERYGHSATLLQNDDVVFYGGRFCAGAACSTAVANSTASIQRLQGDNSFTNASGFAVDKRAFHTATLLPDGTILAAGGTNGSNILHTAEIFNPITETFSPIEGTMRYVRDLHTATLLPNGRVLVAGGDTTNAISTGPTNTAEIYYPDRKVFIETTPMISSRSNHTAIMLPDGRVFAAGGFGTNSLLQNDVPSDTAEIYISTQAYWIAAENMPAGCERALHATVSLKDGRIMLIGGVDTGGSLATSAVYDPALNSWGGDCTTVPAMPTALHSHSATLLFDGRVLVAGGNDDLGEANKSFIYDPGANSWTATDPLPLREPRFNHTATLLPNGTVMISGGLQRFGNVPASLEVFHVNASSWVAGNNTFAGGARTFHTMTLALNNKIYGIGGSDGAIDGAGVSFYDTVEAGDFTAAPDAVSKNAPPSLRQSTITATSPSLFLPNTTLTITGSRFRGETEASGGGAASANSAFSFPRLVLQQVDGSGGTASQSNGGFAVDLTTQIFLNSDNFTTMNTSFTVALPPTSAALPLGWYAARAGANAVYSNGRLVQVGPAKPTQAPTGIAGLATGVSSITWTWNQISSVDGYNVYNATTGVFLSTVPATASPTFFQTGLAPSATSSILIAAYTLSGDGPLSASPTNYTLPARPLGVTVASVTSVSLVLSWDTGGNAFPGTTYEVTQSSDDFVTDFSTPVPQLFSLTTNFTEITNLSVSTLYSFRVRAFNPGGVASAFSASVTTRTLFTTVSQPQVAARTTTSIDWGWTDPGGVINYRVYNATTGVLLGTPVLNSFTEVNLATNTAHSIIVSAVAAAGEGPLSPSATAFTAAASPAAVLPAVTGLTTSSFLLNWTSNDNPLQTQYRILATIFAGDGSIVGTSTTTTTAFSLGLGGFTPSTLIGYEIVAVNGDDLDSGAVSGSTWTLPTAPIPLTTLQTTLTTISVGWSANNNSSSATYQVTFSRDDFALDIATAIAFGAQFGGTSATITGLITSATYSVRVIASNPFGQLSQFSNTVTTRTFNGGGPEGSIQGSFLAAEDSTLTGTLGNGRLIQLRAAARTFPSDVIVTLSSFTPAGTLCPNATNIGFSIYSTPTLQPTGSLYLTFDFTPAELGAIPANRALLLRYNPVSNTCVPLETAVDTVNGRMTARINHFSLFQVGSVALATTVEAARLFPNPYYTGRAGFVTIDNIPPFARVRIFTLRGEQVLDVKANSAGLLTWSGTNGFGRAVASGVYLVMVESGGTKKILKLAVIR